MREQADGLMESGATAIAYETVTAPNGSLPLLTPMSEVAGRMSIQVGAASLQKANGGFGVLLGGVPGVAPAKVVILGGGVSGTHAAEMAVGLRADVTVVDRSVNRLRELSAIFGWRCAPIYSTTATIERLVRDADLVIGAVLVAGAAAPKLVTRAMVKTMKPGAVLVDISIDQGGCFETSRPTTHADPTFVVDGVIHYCVANMPGAVPRTSTLALTNATLPYVRALADLGWQAAPAARPGARRGPERARRARSPTRSSPGRSVAARALTRPEARAENGQVPTKEGGRLRARPLPYDHLAHDTGGACDEDCIADCDVRPRRRCGVRRSGDLPDRPGPHLSELRGRSLRGHVGVARQVRQVLRRRSSSTRTRVPVRWISPST